VAPSAALDWQIKNTNKIRIAIQKATNGAFFISKDPFDRNLLVYRSSEKN
jgi:hypothetical protein